MSKSCTSGVVLLHSTCVQLTQDSKQKRRPAINCSYPFTLFYPYLICVPTLRYIQAGGSMLYYILWRAKPTYWYHSPFITVSRPFCSMFFAYSSILYLIGASFNGTISLSSMTDTNSSFFGKVRTSFMPACLNFGTVSATYSSLQCPIGTSFRTASLLLGTVPNTNSSLYNMVGTSFLTASLSLCTVPNTNSSGLYLIYTSFLTASLAFCTVPNTNSSLYNMVVASFNGTISLSSMTDAYSSSLGIAGASFISALFPHTF